MPSVTIAPYIEGNCQGKVVFFTNKSQYFIFTGKCGNSRIVAHFRHNGDIFIDQLPVSITKITTCHKDVKYVVTTMPFQFYTIVNVHQNFSWLQVFFQVIVCSILLMFYEYMLLEESHFFIKKCSKKKMFKSSGGKKDSTL